MLTFFCEIGAEAAVNCLIWVRVRGCGRGVERIERRGIVEEAQVVHSGVL